MNYGQIRSSRPAVFIDRNKKAATPVQTGAASKPNCIYTITASTGGATPHKEFANEPYGRPEPSTSMLVDLFNPERWCERVRLATLRDQAAESVQQPVVEEPHYCFDYVVGRSSVPATETPECTGGPRVLAGGSGERGHEGQASVGDAIEAARAEARSSEEVSRG